MPFPMIDYRKLCAELADALEAWLQAIHLGGYPPQDGADADLITRARIALAQPAPEEPTDEELYDLAAEYDGEPIQSMRAALTSWGNITPIPIPVSERLPGPEDLDAEGRCWFSSRLNADGRWNLEDRTSGLSSRWYSHWLPHWALPLPAVDPGP
jgi:hypothetical protein